MIEPAAVAEYWNAAADAFDDEPDHGLRDPDVRRAWEAALRGWLPERAGAALDLGCGTGSLAALLAGAGCRVVGVDLAERMVARARRKVPEGRFVIGDAARPPVARGRFDVVLGRHVVWALPDPAAAVGEWAARLRPGGTLVLVEGRWGEAAGAGDDGSAGHRSTDSRSADGRSIDSWSADDRTADDRSTDSWTADGRSIDSWSADDRTTDDRTTDDRTADDRPADSRSTEAARVAEPWAVGFRPGELAELVRPHVSDLRVEILHDRPELWGRPVADVRFAVIARR